MFSVKVSNLLNSKGELDVVISTKPQIKTMDVQFSLADISSMTPPAPPSPQLERKLSTLYFNAKDSPSPPSSPNTSSYLKPTSYRAPAIQEVKKRLNNNASVNVTPSASSPRIPRPSSRDRVSKL